VGKGEQRGRTLGFPTANLLGVEEHLPAFGVYACAVDLDQAGVFGRLGLGALNVGVRPTLTDAATAPSAEVHLLDFEGDLYGRRLRVHLVSRLREERRFANLGALREQIQLDVAEVRERLSHMDGGSQGAWF
jgi:riboflavin kinase/FMN adenylyltransferase